MISTEALGTLDTAASSLAETSRKWPPREFLGPRAKGNLAPLLQFSK